MGGVYTLFHVVLPPAVPRKWFGSVDCDTIYVYALCIYLSLCTQSADPNHFRGTAGRITEPHPLVTLHI